MDATPLVAHDFAPGRTEFLDHVLAGLSRPQKTISPKFLYDARGSELFEAICELEEYYPTRTEFGILADRAREIATLIGPEAVLIEYGAGASRKVRLLLDALTAAGTPPAAFMPIDISGDHLLEAAAALAADYSDLRIVPVSADYTQDFELPLPEHAAGAKRVVFFPGSTIGNFTPGEAAAFLDKTAALLRASPAGGEMIVGADLEKDEAILNAAYDDREGITAAFNMNLLARMNAELGADFDLRAFRHKAFYNPEKRRVEMHLVSQKPQRVHIAGRRFTFRADETIHTENSHKFSLAGFRERARDHGLLPLRTWTDSDRLFSVHYLATAH